MSHIRTIEELGNTQAIPVVRETAPSEEAQVIRCHVCSASHWDGIRFSRYGCYCLQSGVTAGWRKAHCRKALSVKQWRRLRAFFQVNKPSLPAPREARPCVIRPGAKRMKLTKRETLLGDRTPTPIRYALIGQTFLKPDENGGTVIKRTRETVTGGVENARREFVVVRISNRNSGRIRDFLNWCSARGLVLYPLSFDREQAQQAVDACRRDYAGVVDMLKSMRDSVEVSSERKEFPHYWEVCGPTLALLGLRQHRSVKEWYSPKRGVTPNPKGSGQTKR